MRRRSIAILSATLTSCSLVVGDLPLHCTEQSDCDALNAANGLDLATDCHVYQCRSDGRGCEKRAQDLDGDKALAAVCAAEAKGEVDCDDSPETGALRTPGRLEACDTYDNDCDDLIDNGAFERSAPPAPDHPFIGRRNIVHLSHARREGWSYLALTSQQGKDFATSVWQYDTLEPARDFKGADVATGAGDCGDGCTLTELVLAAEPDVLVTLGINHAGCGLGEARVAGAGSSFAPGEDRLLWATSLSHSTCVPTPPKEGASSASLALLARPRGSPQGLALWRASPDTAHEGAPLAGNGVWIDAKGTAPPNLRSTGGDAPQQLENSDGRDAAAIAAWYGRDEAGYFVAYDTAHAVEFAFVSALAAPTAPAMNGWLAASLKEEAPRAVALALGESDAKSVRPAGLAAAWRTEAGEIRFARISFDGDATSALKPEPPETLQPATTIVDGPEIVYLPQGIGDPVSAPEASTGGWFVTWVEGTGATSRMVGVHVPEGSGEGEPPFLIFEGHRLAHLFAYRADDTTPGYGFIDAEADTQQLYIGSLKCSSND